MGLGLRDMQRQHQRSDIHQSLLGKDDPHAKLLLGRGKRGRSRKKGHERKIVKGKENKRKNLQIWQRSTEREEFRSFKVSNLSTKTLNCSISKVLMGNLPKPFGYIESSTLTLYLCCSARKHCILCICCVFVFNYDDTHLTARDRK